MSIDVWWMPGSRWPKIIAFGVAYGATMLAPLVNDQLVPPVKGYALVGELGVIGALLAWFTVAWWMKRSRPTQVVAGAVSALATLSALMVVVPDRVTAYGVREMGANLFGYEACAVQRGTRVQLGVRAVEGRWTAEVDVRQAAVAGEWFWVMRFSQDRDPQAYFAEAELPQAMAGQGRHVVELGEPSGAGAQRFAVMCADPTGQANLRQFREHASDPTWDGVRRSLPPGVTAISNEVSIQGDLGGT